MIGTNEIDKRPWKLWAASIGAGAGGLAGGIRLISDHKVLSAWPFLLLGLAGLFTFLCIEYRLRSQLREHWCNWKSRAHESDEEFLRGCGFSPESQEAGVALKVRKALGETAGIPAATIYANDSMRNSIWGSIELLDIWFRTERTSGIRIDKNWLDLACKRASGDSKIPPGVIGNNVLVKHLVTAIVDSAGAPFET